MIYQHRLLLGRYQLQTLFARLCLSRRVALSTKGLTSSFGNFNSFEQHDAQELCRKLFEHLDEVQESVESNNDPANAATTQSSIDSIFAGTAVSYLESCDGVHKRQVPEKFLDLEVRM